MRGTPVASISLGSNPATVGLDIGTDHIRVAQVKPVGAGFQLTGYNMVGVPMGAVVEGEIVDVEAVAASIRELVRTSGLRVKDCAIGVSNQKVVVRLIDQPFMERAELQGAIQYQAQDYIPIPIEDAILDFQIIGDYMTTADEHMMEVLLVAAQRDMVGNAVRAVEEAGLRLQQIDVTSFAIVRALVPPVQSVLPDEAEEAGEATGIIHISSGLTNIAVVEKGVPRFTRVSALAGNQFTQAIANSLNLTFDEAEDLKLRVGLPDIDQHTSGDLPPDLDPVRAQTAQDALEREVSKFIAEVRRSLDYYLTQATQVRTIRKILLTGSGAQLDNLAGYLEKGLQAEVRLADPLAWIQVAPHAADTAQRDRMGSVAAIGLAMGGAVS
jgi:type IV pilus assembly protein PilM